MGMAAMAISRRFAYAATALCTRLLHTLLRGVSQDRLDLLGEEYFQYVLKPQLRVKPWRGCWLRCVPGKKLSW